MALFTMSPSFADVGQTLNFDASGSYDSDGNISFYSWDFGDGKIYDAIGKDNFTASHSYSVAGTYTITLKVVDNDGFSNSTTKNLSISNPAGGSCDSIGGWCESPPCPHGWADEGRLDCGSLGTCCVCRILPCPR